MTSVMLAAFGSCLLFIACCRRLLAHRRRTRAAAAALRLAQELNTSSRLGRMDAVTALLALGAQPSWREDTLGLTALHMAAVGGHCDILETLLRAGAPLETLCDEGRSPLACAVANGQAGAVDTLLRAGASVRAGTSVRLDAALQLPQGTRSSRTAAECIVRSLLAAGLPVDLRAAPPHNSPLLGALLRQPHLLLAALEGAHVRCLELNPAALSAASGRAVTAAKALCVSAAGVEVRAVADRVAHVTLHGILSIPQLGWWTGAVASSWAADRAAAAHANAAIARLRAHAIAPPSADTASCAIAVARLTKAGQAASAWRALARTMGADLVAAGAAAQATLSSLQGAHLHLLARVQ